MGMLIVIGVRLLELMFAIGLLGSTIVLILSGIEDFETLLGSDDTTH